ncbi:MAG: gliding motility-associated C-terminal domain-containing protein, partial [Bacteroidota bacterium]
VYPGATEQCNSIDDNCNTLIDDGVVFITYYADADGDGFGDAGSTTLACTAPEGYVTDNTDCDDASATVYPGATEICNTIDDNCNGQIDEGVLLTFYADADGDGFGDAGSTTLACTAPEGYVTDNTDCDDASATVYPGATEVCNGIDDNCNGQIDEGVLLTFYADADGDGFGDAGSTTLACTAPEGYVTDNTDCDDTDALNDSNSAPFAANTEITIETHQGFTSISLAELVSDAAGDVLNFTVVENANVSLVGSDLNVTWSTDFVGTLSITYVVCDQGGNSCDPEIECDTAAVTVFVYNGNPLAINDAAFTNEDEQVTVSVTDNDSDTDGTINTATVDLDPNTEGIQTEFTTTNGQWNVDGNGLLTFTPNSNFNGVDSLNYVVQDNDGLFSNEATVVITVNAINDQVQANDDNANVVEGSTSIIDVASNDTDTDGVVDVNTIEIITLPSHGNASVNVNGQIEFIPNSNFDGLDSLAYVICDNGLPLPAQCDTAWVYITISSCVSNPANDCDNDGLTNEEEENNGTDPLNPDSDGDGVIDGTEVADNTNPIDPCNLVLASVSVTQSEAWYALDCDGDSIPNGEENGTDPLNEDSDGDGVSDSDEIQDSTNPNDPCSLILASVTLTPSTEWYTLDCDGDSIPNGEENGTDPLSEDTDGDGVSDNDEIQDGTNPNDPCSLILASVTLTPSPEWFTLDCDGDSIPNGEENGTDPLSEDTDGDGVSDSDEVQDGTNPNDPCSLILASVTLTPSLEWYTLDCDGDSIPNGEESGTDPLSEDTDGDGVSDSDELQDVTNPLDPCNLILASVTLTPSPEWYTLDCDGDSIPNGEENGTDPLNPDTDGDGVTDADEIQDGTDPTNPCEFLPESITVQVDSSWFEVDCDNDGLTNGEELIGNLEWNDPDTDGDGVLDGTEIIDGTSPLDPCSLLVASITLTPEFDWIALDCDNDGLDNGAELSNNTNPLNPDTDGDGVTDGAEVGDITNPLDPCEYVVSSVTLTPSANWYALDCDGDSLSNGDELVNNTDVFNPDTDGDGVTDGTEVADNTIPTDPCSLVLTSISLTPIASWVDLDCDNDDLTNGDEVAYNTDPFNPDTDGDGVVDGVEVADATIPTDPCSLTFASITLEPSIAWGDLDCDGDSITNAEELIGGIDPFNPDTDGDGVTDGTEAIDGTDPLDPCSYVFTSQTLDPSTEWENLDCDGDGLTNLEEANGGSDPNDPCSPVPCDIMIPQAITPNGDGFNDVLIINGIENYPDHELIIFNRWGAEVFRATAYQNDWNGNSQSNLNVGGDELPSGTYYYLFDTKVEGNEVMKGFIYLKR